MNDSQLRCEKAFRNCSGSAALLALVWVCASAGLSRPIAWRVGTGATHPKTVPIIGKSSLCFFHFVRMTEYYTILNVLINDYYYYAD